MSAKDAAATDQYIKKRMSRSGSIPCGNLHLTLDIPYRVKCYQSLTPIQNLRRQERILTCWSFFNMVSFYYDGRVFLM